MLIRTSAHSFIPAFAHPHIYASAHSYSAVQECDASGDQ